jgi:hypothetical protein
MITDADTDAAITQSHNRGTQAALDETSRRGGADPDKRTPLGKTENTMEREIAVVDWIGLAALPGPALSLTYSHGNAP